MRSFLVAGLVMLAACGDKEGDATAGQAVYDRTCLACHGTDGAAGVEVEGEPAADLNFEVNDLSDEELTETTQNGYGAMPAQNVTDDEMVDLLAYLHQEFDAAE